MRQTPDKLRELAARLKGKMNLRSLVLTLAVLVVFTTTYLLILPAFTLDKDEAAEQGGIDVVAIETAAEEAKEDAAVETADVKEEVTAETTEEADKTESEDVKEETSENKAETKSEEKSDVKLLTKKKTINADQAKGDDFAVSAVVGKDAKVPADVTLTATELDKKTDGFDYDQYKKDALEALKKDSSDVKAIKSIKFYDISLESDSQENSVEPSAPVNVKIAFEDGMKVDNADNIRIVHFAAQDNGTEKPVVLDTTENKVETTTNASGSKVTEASFDTDGFSKYAVVEVETIEKTITTSDGETYKVTVKYDDKAGIPDGATLDVKELKGASYDEYLEKAADKLGKSADELRFAKFFDITIMDGSKEVKIDDSVRVEIKLQDKDNLGEDTQVLHFASANKIDEVKSEAVGDTVKFEAEGFSVYAIVGTETIEKEITLTTPDGDVTYVVSITYGEDAQIPDNATLEVAEIERNSEKYNKAKEEIVNAKKTNDAEFDEASFRMAALDISILDENGKPVEPAEGAEVKVSLKVKELPASEEVLYKTMEVQHLNESSGKTEVETVADASTVKVANGEANAEFTLDSFSTFALTWTSGSATVHWGTINTDGSFNEFDAAELDTSVGSIELKASYSGYEYVDAVYYTTEPATVSVDASTTVSGRTFINDVITKETATGSTGNYHWVAEDAHNNAEEFTIADNSHIYAVYQVPEEGSSHPATPEGATNIPTPTTKKTVSTNTNEDGTPDGTYTIELDITGKEISQTTKTGANVIVVFDNSGSMSASVGSITRLQAAKNAVGTLVTALNPSVNDIDMAFIHFAASASYHQWNESYWTKNGSDITSAANALSTNAGGTNWNQALQYAYNVSATADDDPTYVIFVTDGQPSTNSLNSSGHSHGSSGTSNTSDLCYTSALAWAKVIAGTKGTNISNTVTDGSGRNARSYTISGTGQGDYLYGIYTGTDNTNMLNYLITGANGVQTITATSADAITAAFNSIAQTIINNLGASGVTTTDGVTELSSVSADVHGAAGAFEYYRKGGTVKNTDGTTSEKYSSTANNGLGETWSDAPGAIYNDDGSVTWDLSSVGTAEAGVTYVLRFTVWPSQEAFDIIANLNNGVVDYDDLSESVKQQIYESGGKYYLKTNTTLNTSYTYAGTTYTDPIDFEQGQMILDETQMNVRKDFAHDINMQDPYTSIVFYLLRDGEYYQKDGTTSATLDESKVFELPVNADNSWTNSIYIAPGVMKDGEVLETGHKYSLDEKILVGNEYEYEFTPQTVRPMEIDGSLKYLVLVDKYNPAPTGATKYYIDDSSKTYRAATDSDTTNVYYVATGENEGSLVGTNRKTAELDITKQIVDNTGNFTEAQLDAETFTYRVSLTVPADADISGITAYEYVPYKSGNTTGPIKLFGYQSSESETIRAIDADVNTFSGSDFSYYTVTTSTTNRQMTDMFSGSGDTKTATIDITLTRKEVIRFTNLPAGTTYTITEMYNNYRQANPSSDADAAGSDKAANIADMGYSTTIATKSRNPVTNTARTGSAEGTTVTGTIDYLDVRYYNQFTNTLNDAIDVELIGEKAHDGYNWLAAGEAERYWFNLTGGTPDTPMPETYPMPVEGAYGRYRFYIQATSDEVGTAVAKSYSFGKIRFTDAGTYSYTINEDNAGTIQVINSTTAVQFDTAKTVTVTITKDGTGKLSASVTGTDTTWDAANLKATTTITNKAPTIDVTATKAWKNADETTTPPTGAKVTFQLYADSTAVDPAHTVELDGTVDKNGEAKAWEATFSGLQKYKVVNGEAVEINYTIGESGKWTGYEPTSTDPVANGGTITNEQSTLWVRFKKADMSGSPLADAVFTFNDGVQTKDITVTSGTDGIMKTSGTDSVDEFELAIRNDPYVMTEITAPAGYLKLADTVNVTVTTAGVQGKIGDTTIIASGTGTKTDPYVLTINNSDGTELPMTGGSGTLPYTLGGIALIMASALMYGFRMRRRERRLN